MSVGDVMPAKVRIPTPTRRFLVVAGGVVLAAPRLACAALARAGERDPSAMPSRASRVPSGVTLRSAPIELAGAWGKMIPHSADEVVELMRHACLDDVRLVSDRQPARLRVDEHTSGQPSIWLHAGDDDMAWILVDIGERAWCQLAYQFGHELGHVLSNSWRRDASPHTPCQWLEEAMVEAFSLRGLRRLAARWKTSPPFPGDNAYSGAILDYRQNVVSKDEQLGAEQGGVADLGAWFARHRSDIEAEGGLLPFAQAAVPVILAEYERTPGCVEALGALNRWPGRASLGLPDYLRAWETSCAALGASPTLPAYLKKTLRVG
jgi:hypothetical protein